MEKLQESQAQYQLRLTKAQGQWVTKLHEAQEKWKKAVNEAGDAITTDLKEIDEKLKAKYAAHKKEVREFYMKWYHDANSAHLMARNDHQKVWDEIYNKEKAFQDAVHPGCKTRMWKNVHLPSGESRWVPVCMQGAVIPKVKLVNPTYSAPWEQAKVPTLKEIRQSASQWAGPQLWTQVVQTGPANSPMGLQPEPGRLLSGMQPSAENIPQINAQGQMAVAPAGANFVA